MDIRSLTFSYRAGPTVLDGVDLTVEEGACHAIVGPSGCGKSTLLRLIAGLEQPNSGSIGFVGERRYPNMTAMVFQTPRLIPWWNVGRNVAIGLEVGGESTGVARHAREFYSSMVGLAGVVKRLPGTLSQGQRSRAGVGRALAHDAEVLLMDEPFAALDHVSRRRFLRELESWWMRVPRTSILVTHDIDEAVALADRVSVMSIRGGTMIHTVDVTVARPRLGGDADDAALVRAAAEVWDALTKST